MRIFHSVVIALAIGAATVSTAQARDSFSFGISVGGYGNGYGGAPPMVYYPTPVYYSERCLLQRASDLLPLSTALLRLCANSRIVWLPKLWRSSLSWTS